MNVLFHIQRVEFGGESFIGRVRVVTMTIPKFSLLHPSEVDCLANKVSVCINEISAQVRAIDHILTVQETEIVCFFS